MTAGELAERQERANNGCLAGLRMGGGIDFSARFIQEGTFGDGEEGACCQRPGAVRECGMKALEYPRDAGKGVPRMAVQVNQPAPDFELSGVVGTTFRKVRLSDYKGKWVVLFFYPLDFTPV